ncbi:anti-sigma factor antagonist [Olsenella phocaeensis]|uniref:anti-sigma factor antagonist n=1 Tax=Olsenella phocaeensis TaxID=1852385 RepID=UPI003A954373
MEEHSNIALVPVDHDLDVSSVDEVRRTLDGLIDGGCRRIVLNLSGMSFVDSAGMALIFREVRRMRQVGGLMSITNASDRVLRSLRIARLVDFAPVSGCGDRPQVQELDPGVLPEWRSTLSIDPTDLAGSRRRVEGMLARLNLAADAAFDLTLAVGEAMGNAVDHTDGHCALVTVARYPDRAVVEVSDCGCGYELGPDGDLPEVSDSGERGRGIRLMRLLADAVTIARKPSGRGTVVRIVKLLG